MTRSKYKTTLLSACLIALGFSSNTVTAQTEKDSNSFIIIGALSKNEYIGSSDYDIVPAIISEFNLLGRNIEIEGLTARAELYSKNSWHAGLATQFDFGRNDEVSNQAIAAMTEIEANVNLGGYLSHKNSNILLNNDELELRVQTTFDASSVHKGSLTTFTSTYTLPLFIPWRFEFELESSYANDNYMNTYFGISQADSITSGLELYQASSGFMDVTVNANIILFSSPTWGAYTRLSYSHLLNDAANSPIIKQEGSVNQSQFGLGIFYRF